MEPSSEDDDRDVSEPELRSNESLQDTASLKVLSQGLVWTVVLWRAQGELVALVF